MGTLGYLGPVGTYSHMAAQTLKGDMTPVAYPSFPALMCALTEGEADCIVMPIENSINGAVVQNLDLLQSTPHVWASDSCKIKVEHRLITLDGVDYADIKRVYSHEQALAQCAGYLFKNFRGAELITTSSTAESVKKLKTRHDAAIAGGQCAAEGLSLSPYCISDVPNNFTQFLLVRRGDAPLSCPSDRVFFSVTCRHEAGALYALLATLSENKINMTKIESRPIKDRTGEFRFFVEIEGDYSSPALHAALSALANKATSLKLLGCYTLNK